MNEGHGITLENLLSIYPEAIAKDKSIYALADAAARLLVKRQDETDMPRIFPEIDRLDEAVLDILACDLKVDWYNYDYPIKTKRELIKNSVLVHKQMGTVYAVKSVLNSMYQDYDLEEWFSYDGTPGCFRLNVNISNGVEAEAVKVQPASEILRRIAPVKRLSAHLEGVSYTFHSPPSVLYAGGGVGNITQLGISTQDDVYDFRHHLYIGGNTAIQAESNIPEKPDRPQFAAAVQVGGKTGIHSVLALPEDATPPPSFSILRTGGVCTIISNLSGEE